MFEFRPGTKHGGFDSAKTRRPELRGPEQWWEEERRPSERWTTTYQWEEIYQDSPRSSFLREPVRTGFEPEQGKESVDACYKASSCCSEPDWSEKVLVSGSRSWSEEASTKGVSERTCLLRESICSGLNTEQGKEDNVPTHDSCNTYSCSDDCSE
jgi:hypothetical protein